MEVSDESGEEGSLLVPEIATLINLKKAQLLQHPLSHQPSTQSCNSATSISEAASATPQIFSNHLNPCSSPSEHQPSSFQARTEEHAVSSEQVKLAIQSEQRGFKEDDVFGDLEPPNCRKRRTFQYSREELLGMQGLCKDFRYGGGDKVRTDIGQILNELMELKRSESKESSNRGSGNRPRNDRQSEAEDMLAIRCSPDVIWDAAFNKNFTQPYEIFSKSGFDSEVGISEDQLSECPSLDIDLLDDSEDSEDDMDSFQQRAFFVSGEPNFDSGPPEDGLEYLRRVRWEASQYPKVKVAKIAPEKLVSRQVHYIPNIPDMPTCDPKLLPTKEWERAFLSDFSKLRMEFVNPSQQFVWSGLEFLPHFKNEKAWKVFCLGSASIDDENESSIVNKDKELAESCTTESAGEDESVNLCQKVCHITGDEILVGARPPSLTVIKSMDEVSRAALFRYHVSWLDDVEGLPENQAVWLFALAIAVDKPLDAQTSAAFRSLWRRCAMIRARKLSEDDKELHMLNMLITISGQYFGQADNC